MSQSPAKAEGGRLAPAGAGRFTLSGELGFDYAARLLAEGDRAFVWGLLSQPSRGERTQGVIDALEEAGVTVDYQEIDPATNADPVAGTATIAGYIASNPDVKLVVTDHGGLTATSVTRNSMMV